MAIEEDILTAHGVKPTANRLLVLRALMGATTPLSLADLETELDTMDRASIFRTLTAFARADIAHMFEDGSGSAKYEYCRAEHGHSVADMHPHFHCERCGDTICLTDVVIPPVRLNEGYEVHAINYTLSGLCPRCARHSQ